MSTTVTFNAIQYIVPSYNDTGYAQGNGNVSSYLVALSTGTLQQSGGLFQLTADADFGPNFGLKALYLKSETATPATAGVLRLAKTDTIDFRNNGGGGNLALGINGSDQLIFNSVVLLTPGVTVAQGGTGVTSMTAYAVLCGGTTSTGAVQSIAGVGSSGQVLTSNGAGALPTFQNVAGTGTVNSGTATNLSYYATSTNAVSNAGDLYYDSTNHTFGVGVASGAGVPLTVKNLAVANSSWVMDTAGTFGTHTNFLSFTYAAAAKGRVGYITNDSNLYLLSFTANSLILGTNTTAAITIDSSQNSTFAGTIIAPAGLVGTPSITFTGDTDTGIYHAGANDLGLAAGGTLAIEVTATKSIFSGLILSGDGAVGTPAFSFGSDQDTGMFRLGANNLQLVTGGTLAMDISSAQAVAIRGTATNNSATAGFVGEYIEAKSSADTTNFPATGTYGDLNSISLTAGDWDVTLIVMVNTSGSGTTTTLDVGISTTTGNSSTGLNQGENLAISQWSFAVNSFVTMALPSYRMSLSGTTTVYAKARADFSGGASAPTCSYRISARRVR